MSNPLTPPHVQRYIKRLENEVAMLRDQNALQADYTKRLESRIAWYKQEMRQLVEIANQINFIAQETESDPTIDRLKKVEAGGDYAR